MTSDFYKWLKEQTERDDLVGDLASDAVKDKNFPKKAQTIRELEGYLSSSHVREALKDAWFEYIRSLPGPFTNFLPTPKCNSCDSESVALSKLEMKKEDVEFTIYCEYCEEEVSQIFSKKKLQSVAHWMNENVI